MDFLAVPKGPKKQSPHPRRSFEILLSISLAFLQPERLCSTLMEMRSHKKVLIVLLFASACGFAQTDVHQLADRVDRHYNNLQTLQTEFTENYRGAGISRTESGTLWLKRPGHMRWEYVQPRDKLFVTDGKTAWFYVPGEKQARKMVLKKLDDLRTPLAYLLGRTRLEKEFAGLSLAPDAVPSAPGNVVLRGVPRSNGGQGLRRSAGGRSRWIFSTYTCSGSGRFHHGIQVQGPEDRRARFRRALQVLATPRGRSHPG